MPDSEKNKFSFGSLGVALGVNTSYVSGPESEKSSTPVSETSQTIEETVEEQDSRYLLVTCLNNFIFLPSTSGIIMLFIRS